MSVTQTTTVSRSAAVAPAGSPSSATTTTHIRIDGQWFDLTRWKHTHPGGAQIIENINGQDATDAFYSLHSKDAIARMRRLPSSTTRPAHLAEPAAPSKATLAFREFRAQLEKEGLFERDWRWELFYTGSVYVMAILGTYLAWTGHPIWATLVLGVCMQQAGWIGHDNTHLRGTFHYWNSVSMQWVNSFSREWWSRKHNMHHVFTNHIGVDVDIQNDPVFHLFFPNPEDDTFWRKMQHWYFVPVASLLFFSWRMQSLQQAWAEPTKREWAAIIAGYLWLLFGVGWKVALASIYLGGLLVAIIVTVTHQSEEMIAADNPIAADYSFVEGQFATTRDARTSDPITEWLWGGMQYQLEHHLFPTMPKYRYQALAPRVKAFAEKNGLDYRVDEGQWEIFMRNFNTLKFFAQEKPPQKKTQ